METKILLVKSTDPVADGRRIEPREYTNDTKSQPSTKLLQCVLNTSPVRYTEHWCNTCSVWRECTNTSVTYVTCQRYISVNPFISLKRTPCPVQQSCTAGSDDKKIVLQKHANSVHMWQNSIFCINGERLILYPLPSFLLDYERAVLSSANKPCARNTLRNSPQEVRRCHPFVVKKSSK